MAIDHCTIHFAVSGTMVNYQQIKIEDIVVYDMQFFWFY